MTSHLVASPLRSRKNCAAELRRGYQTRKQEAKAYELISTLVSFGKGGKRQNRAKSWDKLDSFLGITL